MTTCMCVLGQINVLSIYLSIYKELGSGPFSVAVQRLRLPSVLRLGPDNLWRGGSLFKSGQSWALEVFFNFFNNKKCFFAFFIKLI